MTGLQDFFSVEHRSDFTVLVEILEAGDLKAGRANGKIDPNLFCSTHYYCRVICDIPELNMVLSLCLLLNFYVSSYCLSTNARHY